MPKIYKLRPNQDELTDKNDAVVETIEDVVTQRHTQKNITKQIADLNQVIADSQDEIVRLEALKVTIQPEVDKAILYVAPKEVIEEEV